MKTLLFASLIFITGCAIGPSFESYAVQASWLGGSINDFKLVMGPPIINEQSPNGSQKLSWHREKTVTGPPRHEFGPGGRIKLRPGRVEYYYCNTFVVADSKGRINNLEFQGHCPGPLLPPIQR